MLKQFHTLSFILGALSTLLFVCTVILCVVDPWVLKLHSVTGLPEFLESFNLLLLYSENGGEVTPEMLANFKNDVAFLQETIKK